MSPESQSLTAALLMGMVDGEWLLYLTIEGENGRVERACRGGREEGIRDKAAGTGHLSGSRSYCALVL